MQQTLLIGFGLASFLAHDFVAPSLAVWLIPSYTALALILFTVNTALLAWSGLRITWWRGVHRLNYLVFALVWLHSWFIGTDTQTRLLRSVWITYLLLVAASTAGRYWPVVRARVRMRRATSMARHAAVR